MADRTWQDVCREITREHDSERLLKLVEELNRSLEQTEEREFRVGHHAPEP